jgi:D-lactate dehydrogenase (cytochrome)
MSSSHVRARRLADVEAPEPVTDPSILEAYLEDASGAPPGRAAGLLRPAHEGEIASFLRKTRGQGITILPQAARSSLTAGAIPRDEVVISVETMSEIGPVDLSPGVATVTVDPGVRLRDLRQELAPRGYYYPPVPTYHDAMIGGTISTNAGGAASFKYGVTRHWIRALRVLLFNGDLLEIERGQCTAGSGEAFRVELTDGVTLAVPVPAYTLPDLKKISAGYHASDPLDLVDLFVGSEGTLGLITRAKLDLVPLPAAEVTGLTFLPGIDQALALTAALRAAGLGARGGSPAVEPDVRAIELMDGGSLDLLREHGDSRRLRVRLPEDAGAALLFELELPEATSNDAAQELLLAFLEGSSPPGGGPLLRLFELLHDHDALEPLELAFPEDHRRAEALREFREAVPTRVNEVLGERRRSVPGVKKVGGDLIVPFDRLGHMLRFYHDGFTRRGLRYAIWGHLSDGNLHPNALPRDAEETRRGHEALLEFADEAARVGGCPLSEHGVGRNPIKQEMLRRFLGDAAVESMRAVKRGLDPEGRFAPGVLFPLEPPDGLAPGHTRAGSRPGPG